MKFASWALAALLLWPIGAAAKPVTLLTPADYFQIYQLYATYSVGIDTNDAGLRTSVFTPDGTMSSDSVSKHVPYDMAQMLKNMGTALRGPRPLGGHVQANFNLVPTEDGVDANAYVMLEPRKPDADGNFIGQPGFYTDRLVKTANGWRFKSREIFEGREFHDPALVAKARALARPARIALPALSSPADAATLTPSDYVAINQLYAGWSISADTGNKAANLSTYAPGGTYANGKSGHRPQSVAAAVSGAPRGIPDSIYHIMMNPHVTPVPGGAHATCYAVIYDGRRDAHGLLVGDKAFYVDRLVKTGDGWRFQSRDEYLARDLAAKKGTP